MGACYDVRLQMQFSAPDAKEKVVATMQKYIKKETSVDFSLDKYAAEGVTTDSLEDLLKICLGGWEKCHPRITQENNGIEYICSFDASYGWERVLMDVFELICPYITNGSEMFISIDNDYDCLVAEDGKCIHYPLKRK